MKIAEATNYLASLTSHILFEYKGKACGVDPLSQNEFNIWYGSVGATVTSIDEVFSTKIYDDKSLTDIWDDITELEF